MTKRVLSLFFVLAAFSFAGSLLVKPPASPMVEADTTSVDLSVVPMDNVEVMADRVSLPSEARATAMGRAIAAAAAIALPEPSTYGLTAMALLTAGLMRRRK
jgi:hypothetical protein